MVRLLSLLLVIAGGAGYPSQVGDCWGLQPPVDGPIVRAFDPTGRFSGHWGIDWELPVGHDIRPAGPGVVSFAGTVVSNRTVTVNHGGGLRTSYSYLDAIHVEQGDRVDLSTVLGTGGKAHGAPALHFSVRTGETYVDPQIFFECGAKSPSAALRLVPARPDR
jgi:murein DD-endopeptidase MepM/ murein hydrolase activator NlpD